jgi:hypothetical protein
MTKNKVKEFSAEEIARATAFFEGDAVDIDTQLRNAAYVYLSRKSRQSHPIGVFDKARRWEPVAPETQNCCGGIRRPSKAYPYSLMTHCRSAEHIANLFGVDKKEMKCVAKGMAK